MTFVTRLAGLLDRFDGALAVQVSRKFPGNPERLRGLHQSWAERQIRERLNAGTVGPGRWPFWRGAPIRFPRPKNRTRW